MHQRIYSLTTIILLFLASCMLHSMKPELSSEEKQQIELRKRIAELPAEVQCKIAGYVGTIDPLVRSYLLTTLAGKKSRMTNTYLESLHKSISSAAYSADNKYLALWTICKNGNYIDIYDTATMQCFQSVSNGDGTIGSFDPQNSRRILSTSEGECILFNTPNYSHFLHKFDNGASHRVTWQPDGQRLLCTDLSCNATNNDVVVRTLAVPSLAVVHETNFGPCRTVNACETILAIYAGAQPKVLMKNQGTNKSSIELRDLATGNVLGTLPSSPGVKRGFFNHSGTQVVLESYDENQKANIWDTETCHKLFDVHTKSRHANDMQAIFSPDDTELFTIEYFCPRARSSSSDATQLVSLWDIEKQQKLFTIALPAIEVLTMNSTCNLSFIIGSENNGTREYCIWNMDPMKKLNKELDYLIVDHLDLLQGFGQAMRYKDLIRATAEQWKTFESLPEKFQEPLEKFIQRPDTNNNN